MSDSHSSAPPGENLVKEISKSIGVLKWFFQTQAPSGSPAFAFNEVLRPVVGSCGPQATSGEEVKAVVDRMRDEELRKRKNEGDGSSGSGGSSDIHADPYGQCRDKSLTMRERTLSMKKAATEVEVETIRQGLSSCLGIALVRSSKVTVGLSVGGGYGVIMSKLPNGTWSAPACVGLLSSGFGLQLGVQFLDMIFLVHTREAMDSLKAGGSMTVGGGNLSAAIGDIGRDAYGGFLVSYQENPDSVERQEQPTIAPSQPHIVAYAKSQGIHVGLSVEGCKLFVKEDATKKMYDGIFMGGEITSRMLLSGTLKPPKEVDELHATLHRMIGVKVGDVTRIPFCLLADEVHGEKTEVSVEDIEEVKEFHGIFVEYLSRGMNVEKIYIDDKGGVKRSIEILTARKGGDIVGYEDGTTIDIADMSHTSHQVSHALEIPKMHESDAGRLLEVASSTSSLTFLAPSIEHAILLKCGLRVLTQFDFKSELIRSDSGNHSVRFNVKSCPPPPPIFDSSAPALSREMGTVLLDFPYVALRVLLLDSRSPIIENWRDANQHYEGIYGDWISLAEAQSDDVVPPTDKSATCLEGHSRVYRRGVVTQRGNEREWSTLSENHYVMVDSGWIKDNEFGGESGANILEFKFIFNRYAHACK